MKKTIAVFFGGVSPEHDISIVTAIASVIKPLELIGDYTVIPIYITKKGVWYSDPALKDIATFRSGKITELCDKLKPVTVAFDGGLSIVSSGVRTKRKPIDIAFPAMHGGNGEDGSLMGLLRMANIPFVGCDMPASVIAMDKLLAKQAAEANDIPVAKYEYLYGHMFAQKPEEILNGIEASLSYPMFVKPTHLGSSIGITRVTDRSQLKEAVEVAAYYDDKIIVEEAVPNLIEVTVPIIGNDETTVAYVERPLAKEEFFDFDSKYMSGGKKNGPKQGAQGYSELPVKLPGSLYDDTVETALAVYRAVECEGLARIDLLIDSKASVVYFNEINPLPGDLYAHNWRAAGVSKIDLVKKLITFAYERYEKQQRLQRTFSTNYLKQF
jgi:D-alanine-D-alanine ligase